MRPNWQSAGLAACVLGLILCPFSFVAIGALASFGAQVTWVGLPLLSSSSGYLLSRYLAKPQRSAVSRWHVLAESVSWTFLAAFLALISRFTLMTRFEQLGLVCLFFLVAALLSLPIVLLRPTALRERLRRVQPRLAGMLLLVIVLAAAVTATVHLVTPARFI